VRVMIKAGFGTKPGTIAIRPERCGSTKCVTPVETNTAAMPEAVAVGQLSNSAAVRDPRPASHQVVHRTRIVVSRRGSKSIMTHLPRRGLESVSYARGLNVNRR